MHKSAKCKRKKAISISFLINENFLTNYQRCHDGFLLLASNIFSHMHSPFIGDFPKTEQYKKCIFHSHLERQSVFLSFSAVTLRS